MGENAKRVTVNLSSSWKSIPKRVINAGHAAVRCSFTARKLDLKEHWLRNYMFLKETKEKMRKTRVHLRGGCFRGK